MVQATQKQHGTMKQVLGWSKGSNLDSSPSHCGPLLSEALLVVIVGPESTVFGPINTMGGKNW